MVIYCRQCKLSVIFQFTMDPTSASTTTIGSADRPMDLTGPEFDYQGPLTAAREEQVRDSARAFKRRRQAWEAEHGNLDGFVDSEVANHTHGFESGGDPADYVAITNRNGTDLAIVAQMMDNWTRTENDAYAHVVKRQRLEIENLRKTIAEFETVVTRQHRAGTVLAERLNMVDRYISQYNVYLHEDEQAFRIEVRRDEAGAIAELMNVQFEERLLESASQLEEDDEVIQAAYELLETSSESENSE